jgi:Fe-S-cluster-containing hydrogenase component 2
MAKSFRPADLPERDGDIELSAEQLVNLSFFARLSEKVKESLARYPGFMQLRRYRKGQVICKQGAEACTGFFILREIDLFYLRDVLSESGGAVNAGRELDTIKALLAAIPTDRRETLSDLYGKRCEADRLFQDALKRKAAKGELDPLRARRQELWDQSCQEPQRFARVFLATGAMATVRSPRGLFGWFRKSAKTQVDGGDLPRSLPFDGPTSIDFRSRQANLNEGELFGEMACLYRRPRSATVVAQRDGYLLEMLSSILDEIDKDPAYQKERDEVYKNRVLDLQLRDLSFFRDLSNQQFAEVFEVLRPLVELERYDAGQLICDEFERSECLYLVREGLVQVKKNVSCLLQQDDIVDWQQLCALLQAGTGSVASIRKMLPDPIVKSLADIEANRAGDAEKSELIHALNDILRDTRLAAALEFKDLLAGPALGEQLPDVPEKPRERTVQHQRRINRWLLEAALPATALRRYRKSPGPEQILTYLSRGEYFGEMGLLSHQPRNATCIAFGQPQRSQYGANELRLGWEHKPYKPTTLEFKKPESAEPQKDTGRVELVRISWPAFKHLLDAFPILREKVAAESARREEHTREKLASQVRYQGDQGLFSSEASRLGLIQGQKLMLIDLERCTRCDECVKACVDTHNDGHTRLHLFGPRFDKYLVPTTCRSCLDPVCMIGCPVRSIQRGDNRQMEIKDWCIGCAKCAKQCPYDSIQIHPLEAFAQPAGSEAEANQMEVTTRAVVCDLCSSLPQGPACVYACPHDAAMRIDARSEFGP